jgi:hypothetical protein
MARELMSRALYLLRALRLFNDYRRATTVTLTALSRRLEHEAGIPESTRQPGLAADIAARIRGIVSATMTMLTVLPHYVRQYIWLRSAASDEVILALATNRLGSTSIETGVRDYLAAITANLGAPPNASAVSAIIQRSHTILIFDPLPVSTLWQYSAALRRERVAVIDCGYVVTMAVLRLPLIAVRLMRTWLFDRAARQLMFSSVYTFRDGVAATLLFEGYGAVLRRRTVPNAYFVTSNSFATELLRSYLLIDANARTVTEIQHGIPPTWEEQYFAALICLAREAGGSTVHRFIPQVNQLPSVGVLDYRPADGAINCFFNKNVRERLASGDWEATLAIACRTVLQVTATQTKTVVVLVTGTTSWFDDSAAVGINNGSFQLEQQMMLRAKETLCEVGIAHVVVYVPHPSLNLTKVREHSFFADNGIVVYDSTIVMWLIADVCLSLYSSTLHESRAFGIDTFTPIRENDQIYPPELLQLIDHPEVNERVQDAISRFLRSRPLPQPTNLMSRAYERLSRMRPEICVS